MRYVDADSFRQCYKFCNRCQFGYHSNVRCNSKKKDFRPERTIRFVERQIIDL